MLRSALLPSEYDYVQSSSGTSHQKTLPMDPPHPSLLSDSPKSPILPTLHSTPSHSRHQSTTSTQTSPQRVILFDVNAPEFVPSSSTTIVEETAVDADVGADEADETLVETDDDDCRADLERLADMRRQNLEQLQSIERTRVLLGLQRKQAQLHHLRTSIISAIDNNDASALDDLDDCIQGLRDGPDGTDLAEFVNHARELVDYGRSAQSDRVQRSAQRTPTEAGRPTDHADVGEQVARSLMNPTEDVENPDSLDTAFRDYVTAQIRSSYFPDESDDEKEVNYRAERNGVPHIQELSDDATVTDNDFLDSNGAKPNALTTEVDMLSSLKSPVTSIRQETANLAVQTNTTIPTITPPSLESTNSDTFDPVHRLQSQLAQLKKLQEEVNTLNQLKALMASQTLSAQPPPTAIGLQSLLTELEQMEQHLQTIETRQTTISSRTQSPVPAATQRRLLRRVQSGRGIDRVVDPLLGRLLAASVEGGHSSDLELLEECERVLKEGGGEGLVGSLDGVEEGLKGEYERNVELNRELREKVEVLRSVNAGRGEGEVARERDGRAEGVRSPGQVPVDRDDESIGSSQLGRSVGLLDVEQIDAIEERVTSQMEDMRAAVEILRKDFEAATPEQRQPLTVVYERLKQKFDEVQSVHDSIQHHRQLTEQFEATNSVLNSTKATDGGSETVDGSKSSTRGSRNVKMSPDLFGDEWISDGTVSPPKSRDAKMWVEEALVEVEGGDVNCRLFEKYKPRIHEQAIKAIETHHRFPAYLMHVMGSLGKVKTAYGLQKIVLALQDVLEEENELLEKESGRTVSVESEDGFGDEGLFEERGRSVKREAMREVEVSEDGSLYFDKASEGRKSEGGDDLDGLFQQLLIDHILNFVDTSNTPTFTPTLLKTIKNFTVQAYKSHITDSPQSRISFTRAAATLTQTQLDYVLEYLEKRLDRELAPFEDLETGGIFRELLVRVLKSVGVGFGDVLAGVGDGFLTDDEEEDGEDYVQEYSPSPVETITDGVERSSDTDDCFGLRSGAFVERHLPAVRKEPETATPDPSNTQQIHHPEKENWSPKSVDTVIHAPSAAKTPNKREPFQFAERGAQDAAALGMRRSATWEDFQTGSGREGGLNGGVVIEGGGGGRKGVRAASLGF
ncbi:hypothetical protein HK097_008389 [Rhizophlyctis rosea]|uniref:Uncharacterized protein n=1 Tax=Rhizophlyctis rosea TaxID=64517 RepID=A0AAD5X3Z1_9FUNG|nr:hypothetical protein HK097_008389 [Rhizophlyctis rosea]